MSRSEHIGDRSTLYNSWRYDALPGWCKCKDVDFIEYRLDPITGDPKPVAIIETTEIPTRPHDFLPKQEDGKDGLSVTIEHRFFERKPTGQAEVPVLIANALGVPCYLVANCKEMSLFWVMNLRRRDQGWTKMTPSQYIEFLTRL
jgi:hypothetical protein